MKIFFASLSIFMLLSTNLVWSASTDREALRRACISNFPNKVNRIVDAFCTCRANAIADNSTSAEIAEVQRFNAAGKDSESLPQVRRIKPLFRACKETAQEALEQLRPQGGTNKNGAAQSPAVSDDPNAGAAQCVEVREVGTESGPKLAAYNNCNYEVKIAFCYLEGAWGDPWGPDERKRCETNPRGNGYYQGMGWMSPGGHWVMEGSRKVTRWKLAACKSPHLPTMGDKHGKYDCVSG